LDEGWKTGSQDTCWPVHEMLKGTNHLYYINIYRCYTFVDN